MGRSERISPKKSFPRLSSLGTQGVMAAKKRAAKAKAKAAKAVKAVNAVKATAAKAKVLVPGAHGAACLTRTFRLG